VADRRITPATDRVAHVSLRGVVEAPAFTAGTPAEVAVPLADLRASPGGVRDRQLVLGDGFLAIDCAEGHVFGRALKDGYCGWLEVGALGAPTAPDHVVAALGSHLYPTPEVRAEAKASLTLGARLRVLGHVGRFARTPHGFVPAQHLRPTGAPGADPAAVAALFLGVPYLWGGNSRDGLDCSGLVQVAMLACGRACPGDSDLQQAVGRALTPADPLRRNDLVFWRGHVGIMADGATLIHANGHHMAVVAEDLEGAAARIAAAGGGPVTARRRP
jgi:hypothetical protein